MSASPSQSPILTRLSGTLDPALATEAALATTSDNTTSDNTNNTNSNPPVTITSPLDALDPETHTAAIIVNNGHQEEDDDDDDDLSEVRFGMDPLDPSDLEPFPSSRSTRTSRSSRVSETAAQPLDALSPVPARPSVAASLPDALSNLTTADDSGHVVTVALDSLSVFGDAARPAGQAAQLGNNDLQTRDQQDPAERMQIISLAPASDTDDPAGDDQILSRSSRSSRSTSERRSGRGNPIDGRGDDGGGGDDDENANAGSISSIKSIRRFVTRSKDGVSTDNLASDDNGVDLVDTTRFEVLKDKSSDRAGIAEDEPATTGVVRDAMSVRSVYEALVVEEQVQPKYVSDVLLRGPGFSIEDISFAEHDDVEPLTVEPAGARDGGARDSESLYHHRRASTEGGTSEMASSDDDDPAALELQPWAPQSALIPEEMATALKEDPYPGSSAADAETDESQTPTVASHASNDQHSPSRMAETASHETPRPSHAQAETPQQAASRPQSMQESVHESIHSSEHASEQVSVQQSANSVNASQPVDPTRELADPAEPVVKPQQVIEAGVMLVVVTAYHAQDLDELELEVGDLIELDMTPASDEEYWWKGTNRSWGKFNGQQGFFPKLAVRLESDPDHPIGGDKTSDQAADARSEQAAGNTSASQASNGSWMVHMGVSAPALMHSAQETSGTDLDASSHTDGPTPAEHESSDPVDQSQLVCPDPVPPGTKVVVKYPYEPTKSDELELKVGELVVVMDAPQGGWWKGMKGLDEKSPKTGWFPATLIIVSVDDPPGGSAGTSKKNTPSHQVGASARRSSNKQTPQSSAQDEASDTVDVSPEQQRKGVSWLRRLGPHSTKSKEKDKEKDRRKRSTSAPLAPAPIVSAPMSVVIPAIPSTASAVSASTATTLSPAVDSAKTDLSSAKTATATALEPEVDTDADALIAALEASAASSSSFTENPHADHRQQQQHHPSPLSLDVSMAAGKPVQDTDLAQSSTYVSPNSIPFPSSASTRASVSTRPISSLDSEANDRPSVSSISEDIGPHRRSVSEPPRPRISLVGDDGMMSPLDTPTGGRPSVTTGGHDSVIRRSSTIRPVSTYGAKTSANIRATMLFQGGAYNPADLLRGASPEKWQDRVGEAYAASLGPNDKKRLAATWELLQTERDYVRDLAVIIEVFVKPMMNLKTVPSKILVSVFANLEQILNVNADFLNQLEIVDDLTNVKAYADAFITTGERFLCYIPFCANQNATLSKLQSTINSKPELRAFVDDANKNPLLRQMDLAGFLIKPVQRICKYPLLLREIVKLTDASHPDHSELQRALERMQRVVSTVNESARRMNGMKLIIDVQGRFSEKINIANPNRFLVREDVIHVMFSGYKKARKLFLFNDLMILARKDWRDKNHVIEKSPLKDIRVCEIVENGAALDSAVTTTMLELEILPTSEFDPPNRYVLAATNIQEKTSWLEAYKSLAKHTVKSKQLSEVAMTSSTREVGDDEDGASAAERRAQESQPSTQSPQQSTWMPSFRREKTAEDEEEIQDAVSKALASKTADFETKFRSLEQQVAATNQTIQDLTASLKDRESQLAERDAVLAQFKTQAEAAAVEIKARDDKLAESVKKLQAAEETAWETSLKIAELEAGVRSTKEQVLQRDRAADEFKASLAAKTAEAAGQASLIESLHATVAQTKAVLNDRSAELAAAQERIAKTDALLLDRNQTLASTQETVAMLETRVAGLQADLDARAKEIALATDKLDAASATIAQQAQEIEQTLETLSQTRQTVAERDAQVDTLKSTVRDRDVQIASLQTVVADRDTSVQSLQGTVRDRDGVIAGLQGAVRDLESKAAGLQQLLSAAVDKTAVREASIRDLESQVEQAQTAIRDRDAKIDSLDRQAKESRTKLAETETALHAMQQRHMQKELLATDLETAIKETKIKVGELQVECTSLQSKLAQKESKLSDAEREFRDYKARLADTETSFATLQQKYTARDAKLAETETQLSNLQSAHSQLKQRHAETEQTLMATQTKCVEQSAKIKKAEGLLSAASSTRQALEQKTAELKGQLTMLQETTARLERERKDLTNETENQSHEIASLTREVRQLRETIKDSKSEAEKAENQRAASLRDAARELGMVEDKWKSMLEKEKRERSAEVAAHSAEYQAYKVSTASELSRLKAEGDSQAKQITKDYEERLAKLREQLESRLDQVRSSLEHEKETALAKADDDKKEQVQRLTAALEAAKSKSQQTSESLKRMLQEAHDKIKERDQTLAAKEETIKAKEVDLVRLAMEAKQLAADLSRVSSASEASRNQYRNMVDDLEKALQDKHLAITRKDAELDDLSRKLVQANERGDELEQTLGRLTRDLDERRRMHEDTIDQAHEAENTIRAELTATKQRLQQAEAACRDLTSQLETAKITVGDLEEGSRRLLMEHGQVKETAAMLSQQVSQMTTEIQRLQVHVRDLSDSLDHKMQESMALAASEASLKETVRRKEEVVHETTLRAERSELRVGELERTVRTLEAEMAGVRESFKAQLAEAKERARQSEADAQKRFENEMEMLRVRHAADLSDRLARAQDARAEAVAKAERDADSLAKQKEAEKAVLAKRVQELEAELGELLETKTQLEGHVSETQLHHETLMGELEDKAKQLIQAKKRIKQAETEMAGLRERVQQMTAVRDEMAGQYRDLFADDQQVRDDLSKARVEMDALHARLGSLQSQLETHAQVDKTLKSTQAELEQMTKGRKQAEASLAASHKATAQHIKQLASVQMTLNEVSKLVGVPAFWTSDELLEIPAKSAKESRKGGTISVRLMDNAYLVRIVSAVSETVALGEQLKDSLAAERIKVAEYQELQRLAEQELASASLALQAIEERVRDRDAAFAQERDILVQQTSAVQQTLDAALRDKQTLETRLKSQTARLTALEKEKYELEQSFIQLYERLKYGKETQAKDAFQLSQRLQAVESEKQALETQIADAHRQAVVLADKARVAESERNRLRDTLEGMHQQRSKTQQLLEAANGTSKSLAFELERCRDQVSHLRDEVHQLRKDRTDAQTHLRLATEKLSAEASAHRDEAVRLSSQLAALRESMDQRAALADKMDEKLQAAEAREKEARSKVAMLSETLKHEKLRALNLESEVDHVKTYASMIESKLQAIHLRTHQYSASAAGGVGSGSGGGGGGVQYAPTGKLPLPLPELAAAGGAQSLWTDAPNQQQHYRSGSLGSPGHLRTYPPLHAMDGGMDHLQSHDTGHITEDVVPLIGMVEELMAYEPELERQQGMQDRLDKLKAALAQSRLPAPARTLFGARGW